MRRHRLGATMGLEIVYFRRPSHDLGLHKRHPVLLAEPGRPCSGRSVPPEQSARFDPLLLPRMHLLTQADIEKALGVKPIETISIHPDRPVYEACRKMLESRARRIPIVDSDDETHRTMVVSVITQYRILKFIAVNVKETQKLRKPLKELNVGTYEDLATASMDTPVMDVIHMLVKKSISSVPIVDKAGMEAA
jgi:CBS domain-containing protein